MNTIATTDTAPAATQGPSIFATMAGKFGMDPRAFERTLMATIIKDGASREQTAAFLLVANRYGLNPFTREVFAFPAKGGGIQAVVSIDGWMKLINEHPDFDGMEFRDTMDEKGALVSVTCRMFRKNRSHPVEVTEYMAECRRGTDTWKQWPSRMLRHKSAIQAARYAFGFAGIVDPDEAERVHDAGVAQVIPATLITDERKQKHDDAAEQYAEHVERIKSAIQDDMPHRVAELWREIPLAAQMDLWLAPTKGGTFSTAERKYIKEKLPPPDMDPDETHDDPAI